MFSPVFCKNTGLSEGEGVEYDQNVSRFFFFPSAIIFSWHFKPAGRNWGGGGEVTHKKLFFPLDPHTAYFLNGAAVLDSTCTAVNVMEMWINGLRKIITTTRVK